MNTGALSWLCSVVFCGAQDRLRNYEKKTRRFILIKVKKRKQDKIKKIRDKSIQNLFKRIRVGNKLLGGTWPKPVSVGGPFWKKPMVSWLSWEIFERIGIRVKANHSVLM